MSKITAKEYKEVFWNETGVHGRFFVIATGNMQSNTYFSVYLLPENLTKKELYASFSTDRSYSEELDQNERVVKVFGYVVGFNVETSYQWLHEGLWEEDFNKIYYRLKEEQLLEQQKRERKSKRLAAKERRRIKNLLKEY